MRAMMIYLGIRSSTTLVRKFKIHFLCFIRREKAFLRGGFQEQMDILLSLHRQRSLDVYLRSAKVE
jgi:hypothetical protein